MLSIIFESAKFNLSKEKNNFINPCCFGEDFATWLKPKLESSGIEVSDVYQEDWGWEINCAHNGQRYYLGLGGLPEIEGKDQGEWRVMFTKPRSFVQALLSKNKLSKDEPIISIVLSILNREGFNDAKLVDE